MAVVNLTTGEMAGNGPNTLYGLGGLDPDWDDTNDATGSIVNGTYRPGDPSVTWTYGYAPIEPPAGVSVSQVTAIGYRVRAFGSVTAFNAAHGPAPDPVLISPTVIDGSGYLAYRFFAPPMGVFTGPDATYNPYEDFEAQYHPEDDLVGSVASVAASILAGTATLLVEAYAPSSGSWDVQVVVPEASIFLVIGGHRRVFPRTDALGASSAKRVVPKPRSEQFSNRRAGGYF